MVPLIAVIALIAGCSSRVGGVAWHSPRSGQREANLALGPTGEHAWLAARIAPRSDWPAIESGLRVESVTFYTDIIYDEESYYGRNGSLYHTTQTVQTGVWLP